MLQEGQQIDRFQIMRRLGAGGMGEVYLAEDTKLQRFVAIKILRSEYFSDSERKERFYREARTAAKVSHPHVMAIHDMGQAVEPRSGGELNYIVMEYIEGTSLTDHLYRAGDDLGLVVRLGEQIASGLAAAHKTGVIHRDIKMDNILVDLNGNPKILDFGLAKPVSPLQMDKGKETTNTISQELTKAGKIVGTISYMSPEQIRGEQIDTRSDIFSFGILLYRMATGTLPFEGESQVSTLAKILESPAPAAISKNNQIPPELDRIITKCLHKDANDRYQDSRDLVVDLRNLRRQYDSSISGKITAVVDKPSKSFTFKFGWKSLAAAAVVLMVLGGIYWQLLSDDDSAGGPPAFAGENSLAILEFENKTGNQELNWMTTGLPEILLTDLAQAKAMTLIGQDRVRDRLRADGLSAGEGFSHTDGLSAAKKMGAAHALSGAYYKLGNDIRIDARMEEIATGRLMFTAKVVGTDPFALVDSLTQKVALALNLQDKMMADGRVSEFTSSSPEAYRQYLQGLANFENELFDKAIAGFDSALTFDTSFALPYLRIAMSHIFQGHNQDGLRWLERAERFKNKLPIRERNILDAYGDLWLRRDLNRAYTKLETIVRDYPNDKETRTIYGIFLNLLSRDTAKAFAQLDSALLIDPGYLLALTSYTDIAAAQKNYDKAMMFAQKARSTHPESPSPYILLAGLYSGQGQHDNAIAEYRALLKRFPDHRIGMTSLYQSYLLTRSFDSALQTLEQLKMSHSHDNYAMYTYYNGLAGLALWKGRFREGINFRKKSLKVAIAANDSNLVANAYEALVSIYDFIEEYDSVLHYSKLGHDWGTPFQKINYPMALAAIKPQLADSARRLFEQGINQFRARLPNQLWPIADGLSMLFEGSIGHDTAMLIKGDSMIYSVNPSGEENVLRDLAVLYVLTGKFQKGVDLLEEFVIGRFVSTSGLRHPMNLYYYARAQEGLGNTQKAAERYREMLTFWNSPDIETKEIKDARLRLSRLTG